MMANKSMKERHWARLATLCNHKFDIESDTFMLRDIMSAPLLKYKDEIEVFIIKLKLKLKQILQSYYLKGYLHFSSERKRY